MPRSRLPCSIAVALLAVAAPARAADGTARSPGDGGASASRTVNLLGLSCEQFLEMPEADRAPIVWYVAGLYKVTGMTAKRFDLDRAENALPSVVKLCRAHPDASLRYQVVDLFSAETKEAKKAARAAKKKAR
jgi:HdeA/HdeB family